MPELTNEQQALLSSSTELVTAFGVLGDDRARLARADADYQGIVEKRAQSSALFNAANTEFLQTPQEPDLLQRLIDATNTLIVDSTRMQALKAVRDDAELTNRIAQNSYDAARSDFQDKVNGFLAPTSL